jgi:hypothetical protein
MRLSERTGMNGLARRVGTVRELGLMGIER